MFAVLGFAIWLYFRTKAGLAIEAVGANEKFARATGINIDSRKIICRVLAAVGMIIYQQSFGFIQLYLAPFYMAFPQSGILIGEL